jgi:hypothetical protein
MAGLWGNQRWRSCVAATQAQCRTLLPGRKGPASAAFERKVFTCCAPATRTTIRRQDNDLSPIRDRQSPSVISGRVRVHLDQIRAHRLIADLHLDLPVSPARQDQAGL